MTTSRKKPTEYDLERLKTNINNVVDSFHKWFRQAPYSYGEMNIAIMVEPDKHPVRYYYENHPDSDYGEEDIKPEYQDNPLTIDFTYKEQLNDFMVTIGCVCLPLQVMRKYYNDLCKLHNYDTVVNKDFYKVYLDMLDVLETAFKKANK